MPKYYSQFGEDRILTTLFAGRTTGTCVEVGANDGVNDSVTYYFELLGWQCALVEPNPELCEQIRSRRRARLFECAASNAPGTSTLHIAEGAQRAHGVSSLGEPGVTPGHFEKFGFVSRAVTVEVRTLDSILEEAGYQAPIDFVSIDVEGFELAVLQGFALERWRPRILILEDNSSFADRTIATYLQQRGYLPFRRSGVNDWYAKQSDTELVSQRATLAYRYKMIQTRIRSRVGALPGVHNATNFVRRTFKIDF